MQQEEGLGKSGHAGITGEDREFLSGSELSGLSFDQLGRLARAVNGEFDQRESELYDRLREFEKREGPREFSLPLASYGVQVRALLGRLGVDADIAVTCRQMGIESERDPSFDFGWQNLGYGANSLSISVWGLNDFREQGEQARRFNLRAFAEGIESVPELGERVKQEWKTNINDPLYGQDGSVIFHTYSRERVDAGNLCDGIRSLPRAGRLALLDELVLMVETNLSVAELPQIL